MKVYLRVKYYSYEMDDPIGFRAFFDNVCYHLEESKWGSKYPIVMKNFYRGEVLNNELDSFSKELYEIKQKFSDIKVEKIIWDIEKFDVKCPYLDNLSEDIVTLSDFWRTSYESEDMFEVINRAIADAKNKNEKILVEFS